VNTWKHFFVHDWSEWRGTKEAWQQRVSYIGDKQWVEFEKLVQFRQCKICKKIERQEIRG